MLTVSPSRAAAPPHRARLVVIIFFMLHGLIFASWIVRIPDVKAQLAQRITARVIASIEHCAANQRHTHQANSH